MRKGEVINGYEILQDSTPAGGRGEISFARKDGKEYFIKAFLAPKFPIEGSPGSPKTITDKRKRCELFEQHHQRLNSAIATKVGSGGNLIHAIDFFRSGTCYYKINEKIDVSSLKPLDISKLPNKSILIILRALTSSLKILHSLSIVHGDLKPDNILIKSTETGGYTAKLIDFDDSYFSANPPDYTEIVGTPDYYSPEVLQYIKNADGSGKENMTTKSDIFTLGIIFHEYLLGKKPNIDAKYRTVAESVENGSPVEIKDLSGQLCNLINSMLHKDKDARPRIEEVLNTLRNGVFEEAVLCRRLRGRLLERGLEGSKSRKSKGLRGTLTNS
jgi:serine/threonine protein kinase